MESNGLKMVTKVTNYVNAFELARHLSGKIGISVAVGESANDTDYSVKVEKKEIPEWDKRVVEEFLDSGYLNMEYGYQTVLTHAANMGWIEEGNYVIRVSW